LGIVLAITMVAGVNIALDSTTNNILRGLLDQVPYDFVAIGYNSDWKNATVALESASRVQEVEPVIDAGVVEIVTWDENGNYTMAGYGSVKGVRPTFQRHMEDFNLDGIIPVENGTVVLPEDIHYWNWQPEKRPKVGDVVGLVYHLWYPPDNFTSIFFNFTVVGFVQSNSYSSSFWWGGEFYDSIFLTIHDAETIRDTIQGSENIYIWTDRDKLIVPFSSEATKTNIVRMQRTLQMTVSPYNVNVEIGGLINAINSFNSQMFFLRVLFIALSLPALVLAIYLGSVGIEMGMDERRREVSIIKARGADTGHITGLFVLEAIVSGTIAGILGLLLGVIASRFLLSVMV